MLCVFCDISVVALCDRFKRILKSRIYEGLQEIDDITQESKGLKRYLKDCLKMEITKVGPI